MDKTAVATKSAPASAPAPSATTTESASNPPVAKLIVLGVGKWGTNIAREAHALGILAAIVDTSIEKLTIAFEKLGSPDNVTKHETLNSALEAYPSLPVAVCTPPFTHFECANAVLAAGRDVWVEKPLCSKLDDAVALVKNARTNNRVVFVDHLLQYYPTYRQLRRLLKSGFVGKVTRVRAIRLNFGTVRTAENALWSLSPHDVSLILAVCGDQLPESVRAEGQCVVSSDIEDYVDVHLSFPTGVRAHLSSSWLHYEKERRLVVYGSDGCLVVNESDVPGKPKLQGFKWSAKRHADGSCVAIEKKEEDMKDALSKIEHVEVTETESPVCVALKEFMRCCSLRSTPITDGEEGVRILRVLSAASEALKTGRKVDVSKDDSGIEEVTGDEEMNGLKTNDSEVTSGEEVNEPKSKSGNGVVKPSADVVLRQDDEPKYFVHPTALVGTNAKIGDGSKIWHFSHIMSGAVLGNNCNIGHSVYIGGKVVLGAGVKVQNHVSVYDGVTIEDEVFLGPHCVFTNVKTPRSAINRRGEYVSTRVRRSATIGANATIVCGVTLGAHCFVGAGSVVTRDVPPHALVYGNPARVQGWVSHNGTRLVVVAKLGDGKMIMQCTESHRMYNFDGVETVEEVVVGTTNEDEGK